MATVHETEDLLREAADENILAALLAGNRARAMLFHLRHYGGTTQEAWRAIKGLADIPNFEEPSHDLHVDRVDRYLTGRGDMKANLIWLSIILLAIAIGAFVVMHNWSRMTTGIASYGWAETQAVVVDARYRSESHWSQQRKVTRHYVRYEYRYEADGKVYSNLVPNQHWVEMFDGQQPRRGDTITVSYDEHNPSTSLHLRDMYQRAFPVVVGLVILIPALGFLTLSISFELSYRDLAKCDPARSSGQCEPDRQGTEVPRAVPC